MARQVHRLKKQLLKWLQVNGMPFKTFKKKKLLILCLWHLLLCESFPDCLLSIGHRYPEFAKTDN